MNFSLKRSNLDSESIIKKVDTFDVEIDYLETVREWL